MKQFWVALFLLTLGSAASSVEAKRLGGGKSLGKQRESITQQQATRPPAAPVAPSAPAQGGAGRWLGPLAGLAAGGLLASLLMGHGFEGIRLMDVALALLLAAGVFALWRMLARPAPRRETLQYAGLGAEAMPSGDPRALHTAPDPSGAPRYPAGFEPGPFLKRAKLSFLRLQEAHDRKQLDALQDLMTPGLFAAVRAEIQGRGELAQKTEVVSLDAELLEVVTEGETAVASVRFSGLVRESLGGVAEPFDEIWHVEKSLAGSRTGWLLAGIQQIA